VSIIVPTYGRPQFLHAAIRSLLEQTYSNIQVIVVDDASPEPVVLSEELADDRVKIIRHVVNQGPGAARNTGLAHALGELVAFLDDDDRYTPDRVERGVREITSPGIHVVQCDPPGRVLQGDCRNTLASGDMPSVLQALLWRTDVVQFDPTLRVAEDIDWWLRMRDKAIYVWSERPGVVLSRHDELRPGVDPMIRLRCREVVALRHVSLLDRAGRAEHLNRVASSAVIAGRRRAAFRYAARSLVCLPTRPGVKLMVLAVCPWVRRRTWIESARS
jgi:glycosyltransferase involved in cell wall biosynthesis